MKTLIYLTALTLLICNVSAQTNERGMTNDILSLKKSNAALKGRLNEQKILLAKQTKRTDSLSAALQSTKVAIMKSNDNEISLAQAVNQLKEQEGSRPSSSGKAGLYTFLIIAGVVLAAFYFKSYLKKELSSVRDVIKQKEEAFNNKAFQINEHIDKEIISVKALFERYAVEIKQLNAKQNVDNKENINNLFVEINKIIESEVSSIKDLVNEQLVRSDNLVNSRIEEFKIRTSSPASNDAVVG